MPGEDFEESHRLIVREGVRTAALAIDPISRPRLMKAHQRQDDVILI